MFFAGRNVRVGKDHTLYAIADGIVSFAQKRKHRFDGRVRLAKVVQVS